MPFVPGIRASWGVLGPPDDPRRVPAAAPWPAAEGHDREAMRDSNQALWTHGPRERAKAFQIHERPNGFRGADCSNVESLGPCAGFQAPGAPDDFRVFWGVPRRRGMLSEANSRPEKCHEVLRFRLIQIPSMTLATWRRDSDGEPQTARLHNGS